ncbi:hypothetical protein HAX54_017668, partial [Datura stramonium]|nr:hypothetical protein [Datura stramonium]
MRLSNVLEALMPNDGRLPVPQTNSQVQIQVQLNLANEYILVYPSLTPAYLGLQPSGNRKIIRISWIFSHQSSMHAKSIEPR